jgi:RNA polymerase sigma factor (sigma-70 family)
MCDEPPVNAAATEAATVGDRELLSDFVFRRDAQAFETIVRRHGPMVYGVVRRILRDPHAEDDAFQATFLVLAKSAGRIRRRQSLASWLHGVAHRIARRAVANLRRSHELTPGMEPTTSHPGLPDEAAYCDVQLLDTELQALAPRFREPLVLHYLEGLSNKEVAERLGLSVTAVEGRMRRARKELRVRMARRGVELTAIIAVLNASNAAASQAAMHTLIGVAAKAGAAAAAGALPAHLFTTNALSMAGKELALMTTTFQFATVLTVSVAAVSLLGYEGGHGPRAATASARPGFSNAIGGPADTDAAAAPAFIAAAEGDPAASPPQGAGSPGGVAPTGLGLPGAPAAEEQPIVPRAEGMAGDYRPRNRNFERIQAALESETTIEFPGNPLRDVMEYTSQIHSIQIRIDEQALADSGISSDEEVSLVLTGVTLQSAMDLILESVAGVPLDYIVDDEILKITTREKADQFLETRVYSVRDLEPTLTGTAVANTIRKSVQPRSWMHIEIVPDGDMGGPTGSMMMSGAMPGMSTNSDAGLTGMMGGYNPGGAGLGEMQIVPDSDGNGTIDALPGCLVITQTQRIHRQIADLLDQLRQHAATTQPYPVPGYPGPQYGAPPVQELPLGSGAATPSAGTSPPVFTPAATSPPVGAAPGAPGTPAVVLPATAPSAQGAPG